MRRLECQAVELARCGRGLALRAVELPFADHVHRLDAGDEDISVVLDLMAVESYRAKAAGAKSKIRAAAEPVTA